MNRRIKMTNSLLLEIGLEELPAQYVRSSAAQLAERVEKFLKESNLPFEGVEVFATPRRLAVRVKNIATKQENKTEIFKGPTLAIAQKDGQWTKAAEGFVKGKGLSVDDIYVEQVNGVDYIHVKKEFIGQEAKAVLAKISQVITDMKFAVTMRWSNHQFEYLRPIHWIVALFGDEVLEEVSVLSVKAGRLSQGHRFLGKPVEISSPESYESQLKEQFVIVEQDERKQMIRSQIEALAAKNDWIIPIDEDLLEEVSSILEFPTVFVGDFDTKYLRVPTPVLVTSMKEHQRYFVVFNKENQLLPHFISARNGDAFAIENVIKGNQKVLTARLEDALFFYQEDQKVDISQFLEKLTTLNFHAKIGSMAEKSARVQRMVEYIGEQLALDARTIQVASHAASMYKFDLVTNMVGEFPELQGIMGEIYAVEHGETKEVAQAIREHYMPTSAEGQLPESQAGALLAVADKLDSFLSFMSIGLIPTGSNDPYALRRQVMGVVQILDAFSWELPLEEVMAYLVDTEYMDILTQEKEALLAAQLTFVKDRIAQKLQTIASQHDVIEATLGSQNLSVPQLTQFVQFLQEKKAMDSFKETIEALNRVVNISKKNDVQVMTVENVQQSLFEKESEKALYDAIVKMNQASYPTLIERYAALEQIVPIITAFFNENMIMVDEVNVRNNRLCMLQNLAQFIQHIADFSVLIIK